MTTQATAEATLPLEEALAAYDPALGLEVHVELNTATKMFCGCPTEFGAEPNTQVCPVCLGLPGALPVVNVRAVESAIRIGLVLSCQIARWCRFARKNYFYPDMPKNFQTSQYDEPIAFDGFLDVELDDGALYRVEIVTKPMLGTGERAPEIARAYVATLRDLLKALDVSDVRMEQGSMRCDVNLSLAPKGADRLGTRTETKNVNSLRSVERAVRFEIGRQAAVLSSGGSVVQETRHWHEDTGVTTSGRVKSDADDYRYFPEPDLVPVAPTAELVEATVRAGASPGAARKWWSGEIARRANAVAQDVPTYAASLGVAPEHVVELEALVRRGRLNDSMARQVLDPVLAGEGTPTAVADARGLELVEDTGALASAVDAVIAANPEVAAKVREGKVAAAGALIGQVMRELKGQADAAAARALILERLGQS